MPRVSVIVPSYNHERYVAESIQSVLDQTYEDFEIIITDDGSTDGTVGEIRKFRDTRIKLFCFKNNQGACVAANHCLKEASGEYIAMLSSDDAFLPDKLEKQVTFLDGHPETAAVFGYAAMIDEDGNPFTDETHFYYNIFNQPNRNRHEWLHYFFYKQNCLCHPSVLIRKKCYEDIGSYDERLAQLPDFDFWVRLSLKYNIHIIREKLVKFRVRTGEENTSGNRLASRIRMAFEYSRILTNYLSIASWKECAAIFPNVELSYGNQDRDLISFAIAMTALKVQSSAHQLFGLDTLFRLLQDTRAVKKIRDQSGFGYTEFIKLTGEIDIFDTSRVFEMERLQRGDLPQPPKSHVRNFSLDPDQLLGHGVPPFERLNLNELDPLTFNRFENFRVSIIIPVWNQWRYTYQCLESILKNTDEVSCEVIVVDNGSTDETREMLKNVENIKIISNETNLGYVKACNQGAGVARGEYLLFLNNDTEPQTGWLQNLLSGAEGDKLIGAVGAKLIYPDGKLQEAGGMIFSDGRGWNFGNGDDPEKEIYNQPCEVDYCSGACLLVRKSLFDELGSFDERYSPGYYEEADLCFALRKRGYRVAYNPKAAVIHYESVTAGKDPSSGLRRYIEINRKKFVEKWENELFDQDEHPSRTGDLPRTACRERLSKHAAPLPRARTVPFESAKKKGLIFFPQNPYPAKTGAHKRCLAVLQGLKKLDYEVTLFSYNLSGSYPWQDESVRYLHDEMGIDVKVYGETQADHQFIDLMSSISSGVVNWNVYTPPGMVEAFRQLFIKLKPDLTIVNYAYWAGLVQPDEFNSALKIIDTLDLVTLSTKMWQRVGEYLKDPPFSPQKVDPSLLEEDFFRRRGLEATLEEYQIYDQFDYAIAVSKLETRAIREHTSYTRAVNIPITSPAVEVKNSYGGPPVFVMGDNPFNIQGYLFLAAKILPVLRSRLPGFQVNVAGEATDKLLPAEGVTLFGYLPDLTILYADSMFAVCPVMGGTGMPVKVIEAMAHGLPVIALRSTGQEIPIAHGETGFIAENAAEFADYMVRLHSDRALCRKMGEASRKRIAEHFSEQILLEKLYEITQGRPNIFRPKLTETIHVGDLSKKLEDREQHIKNLECILRDKEAHIKNLERQREENYQDWQAHEKNLKAMIEDRGAHIQNLEHLLEDRKQHIKNLEYILQDKEAHIGNLERQREESYRDWQAQWNDLNKIIQEKGQENLKLKMTLSERNHQIELLEHPKGLREKAARIWKILKGGRDD